MLQCRTKLLQCNTYCLQALDFLTHNVWTTCLARKRGVPLYAFNLEEDSHGFFRRGEIPLYSPAPYARGKNQSLFDGLERALAGMSPREAGADKHLAQCLETQGVGKQSKTHRANAKQRRAQAAQVQGGDEEEEAQEAHFHHEGDDEQGAAKKSSDAGSANTYAAWSEEGQLEKARKLILTLSLTLTSLP